MALVTGLIGILAVASVWIVAEFVGQKFLEDAAEEDHVAAFDSDMDKLNAGDSNVVNIDPAPGQYIYP